MVTVQSVFNMTNDEFLAHVELRHPLLRFAARGEHEALHRLWAISDHVHVARMGKNSRNQLSSARSARRTTVDRLRLRAHSSGR
jgi:hypothetical protein